MTNETSTKDIGISSEELFKLLQNNESLLLFDIRPQDSYYTGHIKGAVHAVCDAKSKETIMPKIPKNVKVVLVHEDDSFSSETAKMMRSMGLDAYYLVGGMQDWKKEVVKESPSTLIKPENLWEKIQEQNVLLLDVREPDEFADFQIPESINIPLSNIFNIEYISKIPQDKEIVTICPHGSMAMVASFALARHGIKSQVLQDGLAGWNQILNPVVAIDNPTIIQVEKVGKGCLSYVLISKGEAVIIDPLFPPEKYSQIVKQKNAKITRIINTHQHADHVSSAQTLSNEIRAPMYESGLEKWDKEVNFLNQGDTLTFGESELKVIHTPGHTPGSMSFFVDEKYVFTGDILFIESIGRPDLRDKAEEFAGDLYSSLHDKLMTLPPKTIVFPAHHGADVKPKNGIFSTTIQEAKKHDVLKLSKEDFVKKVLNLSLPRPMNYQKIIQINKGSLPLIRTDVPDLELGPNRCSISGL